MVKDWYVAKRKDDVSRAGMYKRRVLLIEVATSTTLQKIEQGVATLVRAVELFATGIKIFD